VKLERVTAIIVKESQEIVRDRLFFSLAFLVPTVLMMLFGFGLSFDVEHIPFVLVDRDNSSLSREYSHKFISSRYFDLQGYAKNENELDSLLITNRIRAVIVIPEHFETDLLAGRPAHLQTLIDGTFPFRARTTIGYVTAINAAATMEVLATFLSQRQGIPLQDAARSLQPVRLDVRYLYNQSLKSIWSLAPKLLMVILMISPPFLTALGIVRERERGSIYNIYSSTVTRGEFVVGKLLPYVGISILNGLVLWILATRLYGTPFKGSMLFFLFALTLYVVCTAGIGLVVSVFVHTQTAAMIATVIITVIPAVLYSGVLIPIASLTRGSQVIAHLLPAMYFTNIVLGCFLKGVGFEALRNDILILAGYACSLFTAGYLFFNKRPSE